MSRTKKPPAVTSVELTDVERMLIVLYRSCPPAQRHDVGSLLFQYWTDGPGDVREKDARYRNACRALQVGKLPVSVFDELTGGVR